MDKHPERKKVINATTNDIRWWINHSSRFAPDGKPVVQILVLVPSALTSPKLKASVAVFVNNALALVKKDYATVCRHQMPDFDENHVVSVDISPWPEDSHIYLKFVEIPHHGVDMGREKWPTRAHCDEALQKIRPWFEEAFGRNGSCEVFDGGVAFMDMESPIDCLALKVFTELRDEQKRTFAMQVVACDNKIEEDKTATQVRNGNDMLNFCKYASETMMKIQHKSMHPFYIGSFARMEEIHSQRGSRLLTTTAQQEEELVNIANSVFGPLLGTLYGVRFMKMMHKTPAHRMGREEAVSIHADPASPAGTATTQSAPPLTFATAKPWQVAQVVANHLRPMFSCDSTNKNDNDDNDAVLPPPIRDDLCKLEDFCCKQGMDGENLMYLARQSGVDGVMTILKSSCVCGEGAGLSTPFVSHVVESLLKSPE